MLAAAGFTDRLLAPAEQGVLATRGLGLTTVVARATATAAELEPREIRAGGQALRAHVQRWRPRWVAILGITVFRQITGERRVAVGRQPITWAGAGLWVLPNPSGLNAGWTTASLTEEFRGLKEVVERGETGGRD